jgi:hypothetical protein
MLFVSAGGVVVLLFDSRAAHAIIVAMAPCRLLEFR